MTSNPRGYYIFINNIDFQKRSKRYGAENDKAFENVLLDMGYLGNYFENKSKKVID